MLQSSFKRKWGSVQQTAGQDTADDPSVHAGEENQLSGLMPATLTTFCHFAISRLRNSWKCSGEPPAGEVYGLSDPMSLAEDHLPGDQRHVTVPMTGWGRTLPDAIET
jgi:hypothetical protein